MLKHALTGFLILIFSFSVLGSSKVPADILNAESLMKKVEEMYSSVNTFEADFRQIYTGSNFGEIFSSGEVYFKKPGMMKWLYRKPGKKIITADGKNLWVYDEGDSQAILDKEFKKENVPSSISFLWGQGRLSETFKYRTLNVEDGKRGRRYTVELFPKEPIPNITKLHFVVDGDTFFIIETSLFDLFGNENRLVFENRKTGKGIKDSFFEFKPPRGVTVVEPPKFSK